LEETQLDEDPDDADTYRQLERKMLEEYTEDEIGKPPGDEGTEDRKKFLREAWERHSLEIVLERIWGTNRSRPTITAEIIKGGQDDGVDSYVIDESDSSQHYGLTIIQSKWYDLDEDGKMKQIKKAQLDKLPADGLKLTGEIAAVELNPDWLDLRQQFDEHRKEDPDFPLRLIFIGGNKSTDDNVNRQIEENNIRIIDYEFLAKHLAEAPILPMPAGLLQVSGNFTTRSGSKATLGSTSAYELCEFFSKEGEARKQNLKLLEYNVRLRLSSGKRKKDKRAAHVLKQTKKTIEEHVEDFVSRNNGLLITAFDVNRKEGDEDLTAGAPDGPVLDDYRPYSNTVTVENPQIVNGGQTINALFDEYEKDDDVWDTRLKSIEVPVKISRVETLEEISEIAYASNNQNPVNDRDLKSRDSRMMQLKQLAHEGAFGDAVFFDIRAGELDYKKEIGEDIAIYGSSPQRLLSNEVSGKIAWALLGGGFKPKQSSEAIWTDHFTYLFHRGTDLDDFPPSQISLPQGKFLDNSTPGDLLREYLWGQMVWNLLKAIASLSKGQLKALADDEAKQAENKARIEIIPYLETMGITIFNAILATKSGNDLDEKKRIVSLLFGDFTTPGGNAVNPDLKRPFLGQATLKKFLNPDEENWNVLLKVDANTEQGEPMTKVIDWLEKITRIACIVYRGLDDAPADFSGTKANYYTNGEGQAKFISDIWESVLDSIADFEFEPEEGVAVAAEVQVEDKEAEDVELIMRTIAKEAGQGALNSICSSTHLGFENKWPDWKDSSKDEIRGAALAFDVTLPDWMNTD
jgi:hypothetical protein